MLPAILSFFALMIFCHLGTGQECLRPAQNESRVIPFEDRQDFPRLPRGTQAIITSYQFYCCGEIRDWQTFTAPRSRGDSEIDYDIRFQVWRPSPEEAYCYTLVGSRSLSDDVDSTYTSHEPYISVQPGDVVGYFQDRSGDGDSFPNEDGEGILLDTSVDDVSVWYHTGIDTLIAGPISCHFGIGPNRMLSSLTMAAPAITVMLEPSPCPMSATQAPATSVLPTPSPSVPTPTATPLPPFIPVTDPSPSTKITLIFTDQNTNSPLGEVTASPPDVVLNDGITTYIIVGVVVIVILLALIATVVVVMAIFKKRELVKSRTAGNHGRLYESSVDLLPRNSRKTANYSPTEIASLDADSPLSNPNYDLMETSPSDHLYSELRNSNLHVGGAERNSGDYCKIGPNVGKKADNSQHYYAEATYSAPIVSSTLDLDPIGVYVPTVEQRRLFSSNYEQQEESSLENYNRLQFFVEDQIYWAPATTTSDLYAQLASKKYREIHRNQISVMEQLGFGQFGEVYSAEWNLSGHGIQLAVKILKPSASEDDKLKFLQEAAIMGQFSHPNIVKLYGVVTMGQPVMICSELLSNGDLRSYLLQTMNLNSDSSVDKMDTQLLFLKFSREIAAGMEYLSQKSFVHRDLAARNVLLDDSLTCKIADFGMARDLMDDTYYRSSGGTIPVKWTAPEALLYKKYSHDSDVYSYGMVLFEIWSVGKKPYSTLSNSEVLRVVPTKACQAPPPGCPRAVYKLMVDCWHPEHEQRPSFKDICSQHLQQSSARMLYWNTDDNRLSLQVEVLGAPLEQAFKLHLDLQEKYTAK